MWSSIANLKENLNKIALDVHEDDDEELEIYGSSNTGDVPASDRRRSHNFAQSKPVSRSPVANGIDLSINYEIEQYKAEIKRLQESEAEIKALSMNYAALLKEKEDQICRLNQENGTLKQNLDATNVALSAARTENSKLSSNSIHVAKGRGDQSSNRQQKPTGQVTNRNQVSNGIVCKQDGIGNDLDLWGKEKELADLLEEKNRSLAAAQATFESQVKEFKMELEKEREKLANVQLKLQEEHKLNTSLQEELHSLRVFKDKYSRDVSKIHDELNEKTSEIRRLQMELSRRDDEHATDIVENMKGVIATLEKENYNIKLKKDELEAALELSRNSSTGKVYPEAPEMLTKHSSSQNGEIDLPGSFPGKEEMDLSLQRLEKDLKETQRERDKALQQLNRLKQHLLEKESEESEKMDEDSKIIEGLRRNNEYQRAQILQLEKALNQAIASQEEVKIINNAEIQKSKEMIDDLNRRLTNCMRTIDARNVELQNLQTALGQYYAEIEAKEHLERDLALAREESAKLSDLLKDADERAESSKREQEEILAKLSQTERMLAEGKGRVNKLEEDNGKLRRALDQSMTRLNRMSLDSDYLVDRRIVIKLLVTYFQRNHSKEVLDLMVRMLGFSDEDKQRIGIAQQGAGKGVVRGVLGLPGRLVGGILGGNSTDAHANMSSENQSFSDLWVDFLLKETEEREKRKSGEDGQSRSTNTSSLSVSDNRTSSSNHRLSRPGMSPSPNFSDLPSRGQLRPFEHSDSEFSTVPLSS